MQWPAPTSLPVPSTTRPHHLPRETPTAPTPECAQAYPVRWVQAVSRVSLAARSPHLPAGERAALSPRQSLALQSRRAKRQCLRRVPLCDCTGAPTAVGVSCAAPLLPRPSGRAHPARNACAMARRTSAAVKGLISRGTLCCSKKPTVSRLRVSPVRKMNRRHSSGAYCSSAR
jgi:hypothetical protein